jgi:hypothetical protein
MYIHLVSRLVRKQVYISEKQERLLKLAAKREHQSEAQLLRSALDRVFLPKSNARNRARRDPLWDIVGLGRSEAADVSRNVDRYLTACPAGERGLCRRGCALRALGPRRVDP